jgi:hypothetical protein
LKSTKHKRVNIDHLITQINTRYIIEKDKKKDIHRRKKYKESLHEHNNEERDDESDASI